LEDKEMVYKMLAKYDTHFVELLGSRYADKKVVIR
jgi:hypothetical protein